MNKLEAFAVGSCCVRCKTSTGICAKRYACGHHLRAMNTIALRRLESRAREIGIEAAIESSMARSLYSATLKHLLAVSVDEVDAREWAERQLRELQSKYPQLADPGHDAAVHLRKLLHPIPEE